jgi:hypothetical protein
VDPLTQGNTQGDWLLAEFGAPNHCREEVTIASGQNLVSGQIVAKITSGGKYSAYDDDASSTGEEIAAGILLADVDATDGDKPGVIIARGPVTVVKSGLTWGSANDATDVTHGYADLLTLGIVAREGV